MVFFPNFSQQSANNTLDVMNLCLLMFMAISIIFGVCEFGEKLSETFGEVYDVYDQFAWYLFPYDVQQMLSIMMIVAQKPVELRVFGSISSNRITFRNVREGFAFY